MPSPARLPGAAQAAWSGGLWAVAVLAALLVVYGGPGHRVFANPDEATSARAIAVVTDRGVPVAPPPFDDPNDLTHQHLWVPVPGGHAPAYPATMPLLFGWLDRLLPYGAWAVLLLPAVGVGSLVAAVGLALPRHRWAAALLPGVAFPATYFALRPWLNIGAMVGAVGVAALLYVLWWRTRHPLWGGLAVGAAALAAALRPDQIHVTLGVSWLAFLAVTRGRYAWRWTAAHVAAGVAVAAVVAFGNQLTTGSWWVTPVDLLDLPAPNRPWAASLPLPVRHLARIVGQNGLPAGWLLARLSRKYLVELGPVWLLTGLAVPLTGAAIVALARSGARRAAVAASVVALLLASLFVTRMSITDYGAALPWASLTHSLPRYSALAYLGAGVAVVAGAVALPAPAIRAATLGAATGLAVAGVAYLVAAPLGAEEDLTHLAARYREVADLPRRVAHDTADPAILYSRTLDRYLWSAEPVGLVQHEGRHRVRGRPGFEPVALDQLPGTLAVAVEEGFVPYLFQVPDAVVAPLTRRVAAAGLHLRPVTVGGLAAYEVRPASELRRG